MNPRGKRIALVALVTAAWICSPAPAQQKVEQKPEQKTVKQTFRESSFTTWKLVGGGFPESYCKITPAGLLCELAGEGVTLCGAEAKFKVRGDFTVIVGYRLMNAPKPDKGNGVGVHVLVRDEKRVQATMQRVNVPSGAMWYVAHRGVPQEDGPTKHDVKTSLSKVDFGKLKIQRKGDVLTWSAADGDFDNSDNFVVLRSEPFSSEDIIELAAKTQSGGATTGVQALITDIEVTGDDLVLPAASKYKGAEEASSVKNQPSVEAPPESLSPVLVGSTAFAFLTLISIIIYLLIKGRRRA